MSLLYHFSCMDCILGEVVGQNHCGAITGNIEVTDFVFDDDAALLMVLLKDLKCSEKPLEPKVFRIKTKVYSYDDLLDGCSVC